ncbi:TetR/AcrR family transcriptional regulator [Cellulomonas bogoriensis]|uniref:HTH tetR-type domain-containing protein n=1 Tax=Cellulomonas bogoriensis 69B4 = DSM 16987 TaxID=1386082 RepID=A0A0A0BQB7_9CELL|nr:TetR family transcriptional regulator [Cellulomonas bogoriensis]KGM09254.1 hypothetical protein N869_07495 [Cellulomonas bogoriensis 69B4 = DSM 16987]
MSRTRDAILDAALAVAAEHGLDATRMEDVATAAGVTRQLVYYHFRSREQLLGELHARALRALGDRLRAGVDAGRPVEDLPAVMLQAMSENQTLCRLLVTEMWGLLAGPGAAATAAEHVDADVIGPLAHWICQATGAEPGPGTTVLARALFGQVTAVALDPVVRGDDLDPHVLEPTLRRLTRAALTTVPRTTESRTATSRTATSRTAESRTATSRTATSPVLAP